MDVIFEKHLDIYKYQGSSSSGLQGTKRRRRWPEF
jgi:hypothetical protein